MKKWMSDELEEVPCDFCGSRKVCVEYIRGDQMRVVECAVCGLAYLNPRPLVQFIPRFYEQDYFNGSAMARGEGGLRLEPAFSQETLPKLDSKKLPRPIKLVNDKFGPIKGKNVLEIGCATGDLLSKLADAGAVAKGLEISDFAADIARKRGLDVTTGTVEQYVSEPYDTFDIVMAFEVIEHVTSPSQFLKDISKLLKPKGLLFLSTPNYSCAHRFTQEWFGFKASYEHIYFFTLEILRRMALGVSFSLQYWETTSWHGGSKKGRTNMFDRNLERLYNFSYLRLEASKSFADSLEGLSFRNEIFRPYGSGHTLFTLFQKD